MRNRIKKACELNADKCCIRQGNISVSYKRLWNDIIHLGTYLYEAGYKGKTIAVSGNSSYEWFLCAMTILCGDFVLAPLDKNLNDADRNHLLEYADVTLLICDNDKAAYSNRLLFSDISSIMNRNDDGYSKYENDILDPKSPSLIIFTSGTTGVSKGVVISRKALAAHVDMVLEAESWPKQTEYFLLAPHHMFCFTQVLTGICLGNDILISQGIANMIAELKELDSEILTVVPIQAELICNFIESSRDRLLPKLKYMLISGAALSDSLRMRLNRLGIAAFNGYGMSEAGGPITTAFTCQSGKPGNNGRVHDAIQIKVLEPDINGVGELVIKSPSQFTEYYKMPEETNRILIDGWLHTGDLGYVDEDNYVFLKGKKKALLILSSGENVAAEELENSLYSIKGIQECLVFNDNDKIGAKIYLRHGEDRECIKQKIYKNNKQFPSYKQIMNIYFVDEPLPKTSTGKIKREMKLD